MRGDTAVTQGAYLCIAVRGAQSRADLRISATRANSARRVAERVRCRGTAALPRCAYCRPPANRELGDLA